MSMHYRTVLNIYASYRKLTVINMQLKTKQHQLYYYTKLFIIIKFNHHFKPI